MTLERMSSFHSPRGWLRHPDRLVAGGLGDPAGHGISGYWPIKAELSLLFWMEALHARGTRIALPVVEAPSAPLVFRAWHRGARIERGHWNIPVPAADAARLIPEITLAPLVGWDPGGNRLGYGGGYFDRTLAALAPRPYVIESASTPAAFQPSFRNRMTSVSTLL